MVSIPEGMVPWAGGPKPSDWSGEAVQFRSGKVMHATPGVVWKLGWDHSYGDGDIIAYTPRTNTTPPTAPVAIEGEREAFIRLLDAADRYNGVHTATGQPMGRLQGDLILAVQHAYRVLGIGRTEKQEPLPASPALPEGAVPVVQGDRNELRSKLVAFLNTWERRREELNVRPDNKRRFIDAHTDAIHRLAATPDTAKALEGLREHIAEQITHVEQRIADGKELGASVWRIALEDVARENRAALAALNPQESPE